MRLTKQEKERLFELLDVMTGRCPHLRINEFVNDKDTKIFWSIYKKLRKEIKDFF